MQIAITSYKTETREEITHSIKRIGAKLISICLIFIPWVDTQKLVLHGWRTQKEIQRNKTWEKTKKKRWIDNY